MIEASPALAISSLWHRPCPACGMDNPTPLYFNRMAPIANIDMSYRVCQCHECGFSYAADLPRPETYANYYSTLSKYDIVDSTNDIAKHDKTRIHTTVECCRQHIPEDSIITDIGCGIGALLDGFRQAGFSKLYGIDPAPDAGHLSEKLFGIQGIQTGSLDEADHLLPLANTGLLCLTGVLEHLPRLYEDTEHILRHLPKAAKVLIEVPALERFSRTEMEPFGAFSLEHVQYFSEFSLKRFMSRFGFSPVFQTIVEIPGLATDSLFSLFNRDGSNAPSAPSNDTYLQEYLCKSAEILDSALLRIASAIPERYLIYGAGSHTARLIPRLRELGLEEGIVGVIDSNRNLHGKKIGGHTIHPPQFLEQCPRVPVLISSHKAQHVLAKRLHDKHPLLLMYPCPS